MRGASVEGTVYSSHRLGRILYVGQCWAPRVSCHCVDGISVDEILAGIVYLPSIEQHSARADSTQAAGAAIRTCSDSVDER